MNLSKDVEITLVKTGVTAGTSEIDSDIIDMAGFDGVLFVAILNTVTDASVLTLLAQQNTANSTSGMAAITGATTGAQTASTSSNKFMYVDVYKPQQEFLRAVLTRTTQNAAIGGILAIKYKAAKRPTIHDATTLLAGAFAVGS